MIESQLIRADTRDSSSRRIFLTRVGHATLSATAVSLLNGCDSMAVNVRRGDAPNDIGTLNKALELEYRALAVYDVVVKTGLLQKPALDFAIEFHDQHNQHATLIASTITKLGGTPLVAQEPSAYHIPEEMLKTQADIVRLAVEMEGQAASTYFGMIPSLGNPELVKAAASIMGDEAMHWAAFRITLGLSPVPSAFIA